LRAQKNPAFLKTDTHMTDAGTIVTVAAIVERLTGEPQARMSQILQSEAPVQSEWIGDLGSRFSPPLSEIRFNSPLKRNIAWFHNEMGGGQNGITDLYVNPAAVYAKRIVVFGDSFGREYTRFLTRFFTESIFLRTPFLHEELLDSLA